MRTPRTNRSVGFLARGTIAAVMFASCLAVAAHDPGDRGAGAATTSSIDPAHLASLTGGTADVKGNVVKVSFPRTDVEIRIDEWNRVPPFMGLTSYASFLPVSGGAMVMGDMVLLEDEVNPAMTAALDRGLEVTALHNHFFFDQPHVYFMHVSGHGTVDELGNAVKGTVDAARAVRRERSALSQSFGAGAPAMPSRIDATVLDGIFGVHGDTKDGMYKAVFGRSTTSGMCDGCTVGSAMGVNTWAALAGTADNAVVDGDFAITEQELQPVLRTLRHGNINVVAIHHHMTDESPRILFLHYWGRGPAVELARTVKTAVDQTSWDGPKR